THPCQLAAVDRSENSRVEGAEIFLLELRLAKILAIERDIFRPDFRQLFERERAGLLGIRDLGKPALRPHGMVVHRVAVVLAARRRDEEAPAVIFAKHRRDITPRRWVAERPFREY